MKQKIEHVGVARNWGLGEQEAGFLASCCLLQHLQGYKELRTRNLWWTDSIQVIKIQAYQIFVLGAISDFRYPKFTQGSLVPL